MYLIFIFQKSYARLIDKLIMKTTVGCTKGKNSVQCMTGDKKVPSQLIECFLWQSGTEWACVHSRLANTVLSFLWGHATNKTCLPWNMWIRLDNMTECFLWHSRYRVSLCTPLIRKYCHKLFVTPCLPWKTMINHQNFI